MFGFRHGMPSPRSIIHLHGIHGLMTTQGIQQHGNQPQGVCILTMLPRCRCMLHFRCSQPTAQPHQGWMEGELRLGLLGDEGIPRAEPAINRVERPEQEGRDNGPEDEVTRNAGAQGRIPSTM